LTSLAIIIGLIYGPNSEEHFNVVFTDLMSQLDTKYQEEDEKHFLSRYDEPEGLIPMRLQLGGMLSKN
jgi:hypothetical protein